MRLIATEEAWSIPEVAEELRKVANSPTQSLDKLLVKGIYDAAVDTSGYGKLDFLSGLKDVEEHRLPQMDELGVDMHLLALTAPGVQMFDADTAMELAQLANDRLAEICRKHPKRFAGLASFAPHSPKRAAKEMERAIHELKLNGFMINSHTHGEYLDDPKFWPILEAAEALDRCIYIHPRAASDTLKGPLQDYGMDSAMWGYGVEVGTHAVRMMAGGVFDHFPKLKVCIGHMGEAVPFWLWRLNFMNSRAQKAGRIAKTKRSMAEYFEDNFYVTNSGVEDGLALRYSID
jgi:2,3-dihydroxybenzoate decarboxylase/5-carboxyvanillate decarboxylase